MTAIQVLVFVTVARASTLQHFDSKIDFWREGTPGVKEEISVDEAGGKFPWKTYLDPKNKEFFKEGDYTPPEPFMEVARNPSEENLKGWFEFMKKKNEVARRLEIKMQEYMVKSSGAGLAVQVGERVAAGEVRHTAGGRQVDAKRFRLRMYFESTCPHCRRMFGVLKKFQDEGFSVEALQVDGGAMPESERVVPIGKADPGELKKHGVKGVPFLLVADLKREALLPPIEGFHDFAEILELLKSAL